MLAQGNSGMPGFPGFPGSVGDPGEVSAKNSHLICFKLICTTYRPSELHQTQACKEKKETKDSQVLNVYNIMEGR